MRELNLDGKKQILDGLQLNPNRYVRDTFSSFDEWYNRAKDVSCPDYARHLIYYLFQPLYDAIMNGEAPKQKYVPVLERVVELSTQYLTGYYLGQPDISIIHKLAEEVNPHLVGKNIDYYYKDRNVDRNGITPENIKLFLKTYIEKIQNGSIQYPDVIVGCACGSSEIVMPLAGILGTKLEFIRKSKRRGDDDAKIISRTQQKRISDTCRDKNVVVVEDYVCSGRSLAVVMKAVEKFKPSGVYGAAVNTGDDIEGITHKLKNKKCYIYDLVS